jgi:pimeloyl-ACP methyl ester carboxylesterase
MKPVVFDNCFGWLHTQGGRHGVVLCSSYGQEAYATHRGWRILAERAANEGLTVLRFDYPGTGDSAGGEHEPATLDAWIDSIAAAVRWLRTQAGVATVSLVGMRLGATLAALAAARIGDIDGLVLLAPVVTGRGYLRELQMRRRKWAASSPAHEAEAREENAHFDLLGYPLHRDDMGALTSIDLRRAESAPARRALILDSHVRGESDGLARHYESRKMSVTQDTFDEYDRFLAEPLLSRLPRAAFARAIRWLAEGATQATLPAARVAAVATDCADRIAIDLRPLKAMERPIVFGPYFGMYCEPRRPSPEFPAVLIVNTSAGHHIGDGRLSVLLARRLASKGIASLRMDLGGLGDSTPAAPEVTIDTVFAPQASRDAAIGAQWLTAQGHRCVVAFGVCSGAYLSLHACADHPALAGAYAINLPKFSHRPAGGPELAQWKRYRQSLLDPRKWARVLRGRAANPLVIARGLCFDAARRGTFAVARWMSRREESGIADPQVRALMRKLHDKQAGVRMIFGEFDDGLPVAIAHLGGNFQALHRYERIRAAVLPGLDHSVLGSQARAAVLADVERWLHDEFVQRYAPVAAGEAASEPA